MMGHLRIREDFKTQEPEVTLDLYLERVNSETVTLMGRDQYGTNWALIDFHSDGEIRKCPALPTKAGKFLFKTDPKNGKLVI